VKEQIQTELQQLKQKDANITQLQSLQEIQETFTELDKVNDELRRHKVGEKGKQMPLMKVQAQIAKSNKYAESPR
jgi:hypothetical protein